MMQGMMKSLLSKDVLYYYCTFTDRWLGPFHLVALIVAAAVAVGITLTFNNSASD